MAFTTFAIVIGAWFMAQAENPVHVEPGKQLPQALTAPTANGTDVTVNYLLFVPKDYKADGKPWPLLLFLHGLGECGDNELDKVKIHGPPNIVETHPDFPFVVVSPQCPPTKDDMKEIMAAWKPDQLIQLIDHVMQQVKVDRTRVYVTGLSMGGYGTWRLAAAHPERFAAAAPICGGGDPKRMAAGLRRVPIWAFHGSADTVVPVASSREMVDAVRRAGGKAKLTVYPGVGHNSWKQTYDNPEVYDWLLEHRGPL
jgi:predicted peptidase